MLWLAVGYASAAHGQSLWEVSPYRIAVWISLSDHPRIPSNWSTELERDLEKQSASLVGAGWRMNAQSTPVLFRADLLAERIPEWQTVVEAIPELLQFDKLLTLNIQAAAEGYALQVRELDLQTQTWSLPLNRSVGTLSQVPNVAFALLCDVFVPLARIVRVGDETVSAAVRAGALVRPTESIRRGKPPTQIEVGQVLQPVIVRTDRSGQVPSGGAKPIEWTVLVVQSCDQGTIECRYFSGYGQPFRTRRSARVDQLAWVVKARLPATVLQLGDRKQPEQPLVGYEVYSRPPDGEKSQLVGRTDWQGQLRIDRDPEHAVRLLFVRSGSQLLGKLPIVPGAQAQSRALLRNDDQRLEAEGFLLGIQEGLVDLVARREVLTARIRQRIEEKDWEGAEQLLQELRRLDTQEGFARRVQQRKQSLTSVSPEVQRKIDELFADTRSLLGQYLDPNRVQQLQAQLDEARRQQPSQGTME